MPETEAPPKRRWKKTKKIACSAITMAVWHVAEAEGEPVRMAEDLARNMADIATMDRESFWVLTLDQKHRIRGKHLVSLGTLTASLVHPREVFKVAILESAAAVAFCHNHPSGDATPSREDIELTRRLVQAGMILGIRILDHVVIGRQNGSLRWVSMRETGIDFDN